MSDKIKPNIAKIIDLAWMWQPLKDLQEQWSSTQ